MSVDWIMNIPPASSGVSSTLFDSSIAAIGGESDPLKLKKKIVVNRKTSEVGVLRDICHYVLVSTSNRRIGQSKENHLGWRIERIYDWGAVICTAAETITIADLIVLLAIVKHGQAHPERTKITEVIEGKKFNVQIRMNKTEIYDAVGNRDWKQVFGDKGNAKKGVEPCFGSVMRLKTWVVQYWENGSKNAIAQQYLSDYDIDSSTYVIAKEFFDDCANGENINLELLKEINAPTAQALYLYLRVHRTRRNMKLETIVRALGLNTESRSQRYEAKVGIIRAFQRLEKLSVVRLSRIGGFYDEKREQFYWDKGTNFFGGRICI